MTSAPHAAWMVVKSVVVAALVIATPVIAVVVAVAVLAVSPLPGAVPDPLPTSEIRPAYLLASDGTPIATLRGFELSLPTQASDITPQVAAAVIAAEDRNFYQHTGVDVGGIVRAARENLDSGGISQGGSTITQQLVKNRYLGGERTFGRKIREAVLAQRIETEMEKDEILLAYLGDSYFGSGAYGLAAAANIYFAKTPAQLDLSETAMIIGMLPAPSAYSPHVDLPQAEAARKRTLNAMRETGSITTAEYTQAVARPLLLLGRPSDAGMVDVNLATMVLPLTGSDFGPFPYFAQYVEKYLVDTLGEQVVYSRGLTVETTLDIGRQTTATELVTDLANRSGDPTVGSALAAVEPSTGFIEVLASSTSWEQSQVNLATGGDTGFQAGSSVKPFVLAAAMERGSPPTRTINAPSVYVTANGTQLRNFGGAAGGTTTMREAIVNSLNTPLLMLAAELDPNVVAATARRLGVTAWGDDRAYGEVIALGAYETSPLQMASAFGTFAARGRHLAPVPVLRVTAADGQVLIDNSLRLPDQALDEVVADNVTSVLTDVVQRGTGTAARLTRPAAGKTGTAENFSAAWFVGYTPELSAAVWLGHVDGVRPLPAIDGVSGITGGTLPASLWRQFMLSALADVPPGAFVPAQPITGPRLVDGAEVVEVEVDPGPVPVQITGLGPRRTPTTPGTTVPPTTVPPSTVPPSTGSPSLGSPTSVPAGAPPATPDP
jgi:penicillin-binding protein 1A